MMRGAIAAAVAAIAFAASAGQPVAFVADVRGNATIEGDGKVAFLGELDAGTKLFLGTGSRVTITYARSGSEFTAIGPGEFVVSAEALRAEKGAAPVRHEVTPLADGAVVTRVSHSATASLRMRGVSKDSAEAAGTNVLEYPVDTRVATLQPMLRWHAGGVRNATLTVRDENGKQVWSGKAARAAVKPAVKLSAATRYVWTVATPKGALGEARFETLPEEQLARVDKSRAAARAFPERVAHALLLHDVGAEQDAREAWAQLARERPDLPELARLANGGSATP